MPPRVGASPLGVNAATCVVLLVVLGMLAENSQAYAEDSKLDSSTSTHQFLMDLIPVILENDGHGAIAGLLRSGLVDYLKIGSIQADSSILSSGEHYLSPIDHSGLLGFDDAGDVADAEIDSAIRAWTHGQRDVAMAHVGKALHMIQDLTVPHHSHLTFLDYHREYERWVLDHHDELPQPTSGIYDFDALVPSHYNDRSRASHWVDFAAHSSWPYIGKADGPDGVDDNLYSAVASQMLPLAGALSAGFVFRMLEILDRAPPTAEAGPDEIVLLGGRATLDGRASTDDIAINAYSWLLPNGSTIGSPVVVFVPTVPGDFVLRLAVTDPFWKLSTDHVTVHVIEPPSMPRLMVPRQVEAAVGEIVEVPAQFSDGFTSESAVWTMGNETSMGSVFARVFNRPGVYALQVRVSEGEEHTAAAESIILVRDMTAPIASFMLAGDFSVGAPIEFDALSSSDNSGINRYFWSFGDGDTDSGPRVRHIYRTPGAYLATLEVSDFDGNRDRVSLLLRVESGYVDASSQASHLTSPIQVRTRPHLEGQLLRVLASMVLLGSCLSAAEVGRFAVAVPRLGSRRCGRIRHR